MLYSVAWIVFKGPPNYGEDTLYSYLIMTGTVGLKPWVVVARDLEVFNKTYDEEVKKWLSEKGFSDPASINHPPNCVYAGETGAVLC